MTSADPILGGRIARYRIERLLGSGGMGSVYAGVQEPLGRPVAVKVLRSELATSAGVVARFKREAELAASLSHPNIAQVTDFGVEDGRAYLVMDLLEGGSLGDVLAHEGRLSDVRVQRIAMQILAALSVAHARGVVHRDLKPENVFVQRVSGMDLVKLLDFGIARVVDVEASMTNTGAVLGTPAYMSPEQARGKKVDARSDVFSLGAVLYEALSGRRPFWGANYHELMFAVVESSPPPLTSLEPPVDAALSAVVERAMAKDPSARWQSADEMAQAIGALPGLSDRTSDRTEGGPRDRSDEALAPTMASDPAVEPPTASAAPRERGRSSAIVIAAGVVAVAILLAGGLVALRGPPEIPAIPRAAPGAEPPAEPPAIEAPAIEAPPMEPLAPRPVVSDSAPVDAGAAEPSAAALVEDEREAAAPAVEPRRSTPRTRVVTCDGNRRELRVIGGRDVVRATFMALEGGARASSTSAVRAAINARSAELTRCYRGHAMMNGQRFDLHVDEAGAVQRVSAIEYCPIDPDVVRCVSRVLSPIEITSSGAGPGVARLGLSHPD